MSNANVVVLTSTEHTSTMAFDNMSSMVSLVAAFVDMHDRWDVKFEMILVHKNNKVLRYRGRKLQDLIDVAYGIQVAGWLSTDEGETPSLNYLDWLDKNLITKVFDSRYTDEERRAIMQDLGHVPEYGTINMGADFDDENEPC